MSKISYRLIKITHIHNAYIIKLSWLEWATASGEASLKIWSCYANFKSLSLFISLEIHCFYGH